MWSDVQITSMICLHLKVFENFRSRWKCLRDRVSSLQRCTGGIRILSPMMSNLIMDTRGNNYSVYTRIRRKEIVFEKYDSECDLWNKILSLALHAMLHKRNIG